MNDFTKDELTEILESVRYWHEGLETRLQDKIQPMIDNYCEHKWDNSCCGCTYGIYCEKCDIHLVEQKDEDEDNF
jgi:hypothetical protein